MTERTDNIEFLKTELTKLFPLNGVRVYERTIIGAPYIDIMYTHNVERSQCVSSIWENDRAYMHFMVDNYDAGYSIEYPTTHCGRVFSDGTVKFRKLKGKTEREVCVKLVTWFTKHQAHILKVGATG